MRKIKAFTLIELLVVIAIIGIVAALVVNMNAGAKTAQKNALVSASKQSLTMMIDSYQSKLNYYPPDNGFLALQTNGPNSSYDAIASTNPLLYELTGATNNSTNCSTSGQIQIFDGTCVDPTLYNTLYNRTAVNNAGSDEPPKNFFSPGPQPKEYTNYYGYAARGLLVPTPFTPTDLPTVYNFWHYDSSSPNRHNLSSYDLWAEYTSSSKGGSNIITTNGNW